MIALLLNQLLAVWLFISAFVLPHTTATAWSSMLSAAAVSAVAFLAFVSPGRPGVRWLMVVVAAWLLMGAMVMPHASMGTAFHDVAVAVALAALALFPPAHWLSHWRQEHEGHPRAAG